MKMGKARSISNMMAALILIAIVAFAGVMLFFMTSSFFKGGGKAAITLTATGTGSSDGKRATINLVIQNTGDGAARISAIYIVPESAGVTVSGKGITAPELPSGVTLGTGIPKVSGTSVPSSGLDLDAKATRTVFLQVSGSGLFAGAQLRVYVVYWDLGSGQPGIADTVVMLK